MCIIMCTSGIEEKDERELGVGAVPERMRTLDGWAGAHAFSQQRVGRGLLVYSRP